MKPALAALAALLLLAASPPPRSFSLVVPEDTSLLPAPAPPPRRIVPASPYQPAPLPNRDLNAPLGPRASNAPSVAPKLFTRSDQYRGDGYAPGSTAQIEQERRVKPGAGFNLRMPLTGQ
ncbi:MAG: hypothetical protein NVSMB18_22160 [Acetobacteraceae bacterium]